MICSLALFINFQSGTKLPIITILLKDSMNGKQMLLVKSLGVLFIPGLADFFRQPLKNLHLSQTQLLEAILKRGLDDAQFVHLSPFNA